VTSRRAVFLDRDGTLIEDSGFLKDPADVRLLPGAAAAVGRLNAGGLATVVVTNQSGIARGLLSESDYRAIERRLDDLLAAAGARLDASFFCPHLPEISGPCDCRKPGVQLYQRAAADLDLDLGASWWIGDRIRDILPAEAFGGMGVLVRTGMGAAEAEAAAAAGFAVESDLAAAVDRILARLPRLSPPDYFQAP